MRIFLYFSASPNLCSWTIIARAIIRIRQAKGHPPPLIFDFAELAFSSDRHTNRLAPVEQDDSVGFQILRAIRRIIRRTSTHSRSVSRHNGVSVPQMLCLKAIAELSANSGATVALVADRVQLSAPTASRILDRLERAGYVERQRATTDRRKVVVTLTQRGGERVKDLPQPLHEQFLNRLHALNAGDQLELLRSLERIVELMDAKDIDASPVLTPELEVGPETNTELETLAVATDDTADSSIIEPSPSLTQYRPANDDLLR